MSESVTSHTLKNGLVLVVERMQGMESAAFTLLCPSGCIYEPEDRLGLAGFCTEMMLRGCGNLDSRGFISALDNLGVERGEGVSDSHCSFSGATLARNLPEVMRIYADLVRAPLFPEDQLEEGRQVVLQELRAVYDEPAHQVMQEVRRQHYPAPWGRPSQGEEAALDAITMAEIQAFHAAYFQPNGAILGVAGNIDADKVIAQAETLFADWAPKNVPLPSGQSKSRQNVTHLPHDTNQTHIGISYPSVPYRHEDYFLAWAGVGVLSGGMSARLFTEVREKRGLCYTVHASYHTLKHAGGVFCHAGTSAERAQETLDVTLGELRRLADGVEDGELKRLKARIKSGLIMQQESSSARSSAVARDWYHLGRVRSMEEVGRIVDDLSCARVNAYLKANPPQDFCIVTLGPQALEIPGGVC